MNKIAFEGQRRSSLETAVLVSDRWSLHILRECFLNFRRFESFQSRLKIPSAKLTERLDRLIGQGLLRRVCYQETPRRYEYILTDKGLDLYRTVFSLLLLRGRRSRLTGMHDRRSGRLELTTCTRQRGKRRRGVRVELAGAPCSKPVWHGLRARSPRRFRSGLAKTRR